MPLFLFLALPESENSYDSNDCVVTGWGPKRELMKYIKLSLVENKRCQELLRATDSITHDWILDVSFNCAGGEKGKDVCEGDGGGPLVCKHKEKDE